MGYAPLSNWKYDNIEVDQKVNLHRIQSGPARPRYVLTNKKNGGYGLNDVGDNFALPYVDAPPVIYGSGTYDDEWRQVPLAVDGYYTNYVGSTEQLAYTVNANHARPPASGVTFNDVFVQGFQSVAGNQQIANSYVSIRMGSNYNNEAGVKYQREAIKYTYFNGVSPTNTQSYSPYNVPFNVSFVSQQTGTQSWTRQANSILTHKTGVPAIDPSTPDSPESDADRAARMAAGVSRANWDYHAPVYCQTRTFWRQLGNNALPGDQPNSVKFVYRDKSTSYGLNYGSVYYQQGENAVRGMYRGFSPSVGTSNVNAFQRRSV